MCKQSEGRSALPVIVALGALALLAATAIVEGDARAGVSLGAGASAPQTAGRIGGEDMVSPAPPALPQDPRTKRLQCWQDGRLLIDAAPVELDKATRREARVVARDRDGEPIVVSDAGRTTCITRPAPTPPNPSLPR
jgi:hypothetical protein